MNKKFKSKLAEARKSVRWSQQELSEKLGTTQHNVSRWECGKTVPGPYFRAKLSVLFGLSVEELGLLEPLNSTRLASLNQPGNNSAGALWTPILWQVPFPRNPCFVGRTELLEQLVLHAHVTSTQPELNNSPIAQVPILALTGLGGVGKTQIALEFAYCCQMQGLFTHTIWMNAATKETLLTGYVELAQLLSLAPKQTDLEGFRGEVIHWLEQSPQRWMLIFDNVNDIDQAIACIPAHGNGLSIITTRLHATGPLARCLEIDTMSAEESRLLLCKRARRELALSPEEEEAVIQIGQVLGHLPLALDQAGAYVEELSCSFCTFLHLLKKHQHEVLAQRGRFARHYPYSLTTTLSLCFQRVAMENPAATELPTFWRCWHLSIFLRN